MRRELRQPALKCGSVVKSVPNCCWYRLLCETCMAKPWPHTADRSVTGTAHLPSLSHIKTRNIFCQYHFVDFSFVGRAGMDGSVACVCLHGSGIILMAELSHRLTGNKNNTAKFTGRGEPETAKVCSELGCREMEWEGLTQSWNVSHFVQKNVRLWGIREPLWQGENSFWVVSSDVQAQATAVSAHSFPPHQSTRNTPQSGHIKFIPGILVIHWHCKCYRSY